MQPIPYYEIIKTTDDLTDKELRILVAAMYFSTLCFICELAMALTNMWMFLIKQEKYKTWPLLMFYVLTISLAVMRTYSSFFKFLIIINNEIFGGLLSAILKLNIGAV